MGARVQMTRSLDLKSMWGGAFYRASVCERKSESVSMVACSQITVNTSREQVSQVSAQLYKVCERIISLASCWVCIDSRESSSHWANFLCSFVHRSAAAMADRGLLLLLERVRSSGQHRWIDMERIVRIFTDNFLKARSIKSGVSPFCIDVLLQVTEDFESLHVTDLVVKGSLSGVDTRFIKAVIAEARAEKKERTISRTPR